MSALPILDDEGHILLPKSVRDAAGFHEGDHVLFKVIGHRKIELTSVPRPSVAEHDERVVEESGEPKIDLDAFQLPRMTLEEVRSRFALNENEAVDFNTLRQVWADEEGELIVDRIRRGLE